MKCNLNIKVFLLPLLFLSFALLDIACSSNTDDNTEVIPPDSKPNPVADPSNAKTTLEATTPESTNGGLISIITVQLAEANGRLLEISGGIIILTTTGSANISAVTDKGDGTYTATITSNAEETVTVSGTLNGVKITNTLVITFNPDESNPAQEIEQSTEPVGPSILRINSGGPEVTYGDITFLEDQFFEGSTEAYSNPFVTEIAGTEMDDIYLTERITDNTDVLGPFSYAIPVANGTYTVKLYFAEIYWGVNNPEMLQGGEGSRIFNVSMEDTVTFIGYDLYKEVGSNTATSRMYDIIVSDGELNIIFEASKNKPKVSAIEVFGNGSVGF